MTIKRILAILLMLSMIFSSTVGCSSKGEDNVKAVISKRKPVKIAGSPNLDYSGQKVGILIPADKPEYYDDVVAAIKSGVNATVEEITWANAATEIDADKYEAIIIPEANSYPANAANSIDKYLQNGGKLLTLGGPPLQEGEEFIEGQWLNQQEAFDTAERKTIVDFSELSEESFTLNADNPGQLGQTIELEDGAPNGGKILHISYPNPKNWAQLSTRVTGNFTGANTISFYASSCYYMTQHGLCIGVNDGTGTYYAVIKPCSDLSLFTLSEEDFYLWANDKINTDKHPNFDNVNSMSFGISQTHTPFHVGKLYEFWISSPTMQKVDKLGEIAIVLDGIAPEYKFYPITNGDTAEASQNQSFVATRKYTLPNELFSAHSRPQGTGYNRDRDQRFVPLIEVRDKKELRSGYLAWMFVYSSGIREVESAYEGCILAGFGTSDPKFYDKNGCAAVVDVLRALLNDYMFIEAGATEDIYVDSETKTLTMGALVRGKATKGMTLNFDFIKNDKSIYNESYDLTSQRLVKTIGDTEVKSKAFEYNVSKGKPDYVVVTIKKDGKVLDTVTQDITFWSPKAEKERKYITTSNNEFIRDGKVIRFYGVSYSPSSGMGTEDDGLWEHYLSREAFDPDVIYNDLLRLKEVGFNSIGTYIYYNDAIEIKSMMWLAYVCDLLDMYLEVDIRPHADPFNLVENEVVETFEKLHLADFDNIVSFGVAWERSFGSYDGNYGNAAGRKAYDDYWIKWVEDNYGSIANAEFEWGESMPTKNGKYTAVSDEMVREKESSELVAAYRRFADDLVASKHAYVRELFVRLAPNHMITARAGDVGCIPLADAARMGYDFTALAAGMDYLSPEYYSDHALSEQMVFTNVYSRYASPDAPVVWKEFQVTAKWRGSNFDDPAYATLRKQIDEESIYGCKQQLENMLAGHTSGLYYWYAQGGYRYNEKSDCGILNPDGSDRAVTKLIREYRDKIMNQPLMNEVDAIIKVDRDQYSNAIAGMYQDMKDELLKAVKGGATVAFTDKATGTNTDTVSDAGVGGGFASETNPARWVNGVFQAVYIKQADGSWQQIKSGDSVYSIGKTLEIKVVMTNMMGSEWLSKSKSKQSYVSLVSTSKSNISFDIPLSKNVKQLETLTQEFTLSTKSVGSGTVVQFRLGIQGRFPFANPFTFTVY